MVKRPSVELASIAARDGCKIALHHFKAENPRMIVLHMHANSYNSMAYISYGSRLASEQISAFLMDSRGNGKSEGQPGTVDYIGQLEDDLEDVISSIKSDHPAIPLFLSGHSGGTAVMLRYIDKYGDQKLAGTVIISPVLPTFLEASRFDLTGSRFAYRLQYFRKKPTYQPPPPETEKFLPEIKGLRFQLCKYLPFLRDMSVLTFPGDAKAAKKANRVLNFSYKLTRCFVVENYADVYRKIRKPIFITIGDEDDVTEPLLLSTINHWYLHPGVKKRVSVQKDANHLNATRKATNAIINWLNELNATAPVSNGKHGIRPC